jgi:serine/threonine-protein kinase RsbW
VSIQIVMMLPPRAASVSLARHALGEALSIPGVSPDCIHEAQLALSEACSNILRHLTTGQNFEVLINIGEVELTVHVLDGEAQSPHDRKLANWPDTDAEHDGGLTLMTAFADHATSSPRTAAEPFASRRDCAGTPVRRCRPRGDDGPAVRVGRELLR